MTYVVPLDIREAVAPDGSTTGTCAELTDDQLQRTIVRAQQLVDGITGVVFGDANVPELVAGLVLALAAYYATLAYRKGLPLSADHPIRLQYDDAQTTLRGIKAGQIKFEPDAPVTDSPPVSAKPRVRNPYPQQIAQLFTLDDAGLTVRTGGRHGPDIEPSNWDGWH